MKVRILSTYGNVIAADFQPTTSPNISVSLSFKSETLYTDKFVLLTRTTALLNDQAILVMHFLGDLTTGATVHLNNKDVTQ